mgnify:CR=1 FL=1
MNTLEIINKIAKTKGINVNLSGSDLSKTLREVNIDSLAAMTLIIAIEEEIKITIPDEELIQLKTLGDLVRAIDKLKK